MINIFFIFILLAIIISLNIYIMSIANKNIKGGMSCAKLFANNYTQKTMDEVNAGIICVSSGDEKKSINEKNKNLFIKNQILTIPSYIEKIEPFTFYNSNIISINFEERSNNTKLIICGGAFRDCIHIKELAIPSFVIYIGDGAFYECSELTITIENKYTNIGAHAFKDCKEVHYRE